MDLGELVGTFSLRSIIILLLAPIFVRFTPNPTPFLTPVLATIALLYFHKRHPHQSSTSVRVARSICRALVYSSIACPIADAIFSGPMNRIILTYFIEHQAFFWFPFLPGYTTETRIYQREKTTIVRLFAVQAVIGVHFMLRVALASMVLANVVAAHIVAIVLLILWDVKVAGRREFSGSLHTPRISRDVAKEEEDKENKDEERINIRKPISKGWRAGVTEDNSGTAWDRTRVVRPRVMHGTDAQDNDVDDENSGTAWDRTRRVVLRRPRAMHGTDAQDNDVDDENSGTAWDRTRRVVLRRPRAMHGTDAQDNDVDDENGTAWDRTRIVRIRGIDGTYAPDNDADDENSGVDVAGEELRRAHQAMEEPTEPTKELAGSKEEPAEPREEPAGPTEAPPHQDPATPVELTQEEKAERKREKRRRNRKNRRARTQATAAGDDAADAGGT